MPFTLRRRSLLTGATGTVGTVLLAGCSDDAPPATAAGAERVPLEQRLRERSARESAQLLGQYDATSAAHPALAARLAPLRAEVARHAQAFGAPQPAASPSPPSSPSGSPAPSPAPAPTVAAEPKQALAALAAAERRTADARTTALLGAPGELARLLASVAASGAVHAYLLTAGDPK